MLDAKDYIILALTAAVLALLVVFAVHNRADESRFRRLQESLDAIKKHLKVPILIFVFGIAFFVYWQYSSNVRREQHDKILVLETLLQAEREKNIDQDSKIDQARNKAEVASRDAARIEGKFDQFSQVFAIKNAHKAKLQITPD